MAVAPVTVLALLLGAGAAGERPLGETRWGPWRVTLAVSPAAPRALAPTRFLLEGADERGRPFEGGAVLYLSPLEAAGATRTLVLRRSGSGRAEGKIRLPDAGPWRVRGVLTGAGAETHAFETPALEVGPFEWISFGREFGLFVGLALVFLTFMFWLARRLRNRSGALAASAGD